MTAPPLSPAEQAVVDRFEAAPECAGMSAETLPTPLSPAWARREATRRMRPMLTEVRTASRAVSQLSDDDYDPARLGAALAEKAYVLQLVDRAEHRV